MDMRLLDDDVGRFCLNKFVKFLITFNMNVKKEALED